MTQCLQYLELTPVAGSFRKGGPHSVTLIAKLPWPSVNGSNAVHSAQLELRVSPELYEILMKDGCSFPIVWEVE